MGEQAEVQTAALAQQADAIALSADADAKKANEESARIQAAQLAKEKKAAAEKAEAEAKAKKEREEKEKVASRSTTRDSSSFQVQSSYTVSQVKAIARQMVPASQFQCFSNIVNHSRVVACSSGSGIARIVTPRFESRKSGTGPASRGRANAR